MLLIGNAAIVYDNMADAATIDASSFIAAAPPATLQNPHVRRRWKGRLGDTERITADLGSDRSLDSIGLFGCQYVDVDDVQRNMTIAAVTRVRASTEAGGVLAGDAYDSGSAAARISEAHGALVIHSEDTITARYIDIDLSQSSAQALLAGRLVIGLRDQFSFNFAAGWARGYEDRSRLKEAAGGQTHIDRDDRRRVLNLSFEALDEDDRYTFVEEADRLNGISRDVMFIIDPESETPDRDTIWGLMTDLSLPTQPSMNFYSKSYSIKERL